MAASAKPIPVFPEVPSIIVPPGFKRPSASASSIIVRAIRSFTELPGLKVSYFANTKQGKSFVSSFIFTKGVFPMVSNMFFAYSISIILPCKGMFLPRIHEFFCFGIENIPIIVVKLFQRVTQKIQNCAKTFRKKFLFS